MRRASFICFMARNFPKFRFKRNQPFKVRPRSNSFNNNKVKSPEKLVRDCYKSGNMNRSSTICYQDNEFGHFATEYKKP